MKSISAFLLALVCIVASVPGWAGGDAMAGKEKSAVCASCHGVDGNSPIAANPRLAGQHASYLAQALRSYKSGERNNPIMAGFAGALSEQDIEDLAAWFASQDGLITPR